MYIEEYKFNGDAIALFYIYTKLERYIEQRSVWHNREMGA